MNKSNPLISVITVVYNAENTIEETIKSVVKQTYKKIEYIIIDGGSNDGTIKVINLYRSHITEFVSEKDNGIFDAMNKGLALANGQYVNFMNSGDQFVNMSVIENFVRKLNNKHDFIFGDTIINKKGKLKMQKSNPFFYKKGINQMGICHQSIFLNTHLAKKYGFDNKYRLAADYNMIYSIIENERPKVLYLNSPVSVFDASFGVSSKHFKRTFKEVLNIYKSFSLTSKLLFLIKSYIRFYISNLLTIIRSR